MELEAQLRASNMKNEDNEVSNNTMRRNDQELSELKKQLQIK